MFAKTGVAYVQIFYVHGTEPKIPLWIDAAIKFDTKEEAVAVAAKFPKAVRVRGSSLSNLRDTTKCGVCTFSVQLRPDGTTGACNETGIKRFRSFCSACEKLGIELVRYGTTGNSYPAEMDIDKILSGCYK